ncbi:I78 family peptidase inhibitor [Pseudomonas sp. Pseusp122]|uniref:I78 family peptidase inhibitor n=1 Tax=unclassified Pseudomonas TaxID=196821 RepID=UPI0039A75A52
MPWKVTSLGFIVATLMLGGCSTSESTSGTTPGAATSATTREDTRCDASGAQFAVGKPASAALLEQARSKSGAQTARVLGPNDMITLEYRSDRLNLNTDSSANVVRVNCG